MTYFLTAKQIVQYKAVSERPTSKKETTTNGKRTKYLLFFGNRNTFHSKMKNPHLRWKCLQSTKMSQLIWSVTIPFRHLRFLFYPLHRGAFGIKRLSRGGESIVEFYIFSALQWESLRYYCVSQIFMRYLRNCGITKHAEFFMVGSAFFSMVHVRGVLIPFKGVFFISWRKSYSVGVEMKPLLPNLLAELALYSSENNVNLQLYTDFSRSNHYDTEWKRSSKWEWCYITCYGTRAELWWGHTER